MPRDRAALATSTPIAPRPMTPMLFPASSCPAKAFFAFSVVFAMSASPAFSFTQRMPPFTSRDASSMPHSTSSFTELAFAPGVLKTTMPLSVQRSIGMLLTPAPARAMARRSFGNSISFMSAERTSTPAASSMLSASS